MAQAAHFTFVRNDFSFSTSSCCLLFLESPLENTASNVSPDPIVSLKPHIVLEYGSFGASYCACHYPQRQGDSLGCSLLRVPVHSEPCGNLAHIREAI